MRITTWNVNSIKQRVGHLLGFLDEARPDVVCLQELKCQDAAFPRAEIEAAGYGVETLGQKAYNGVALLVRRPLASTQLRRGLPGDAEDEQARYIEALVHGDGVAPVRVASIYLPNGNPAPGPKYAYKLAFMDRLRRHARALMATEEALVLAGDYNVIPEPEDAADPSAWTQDALFLPETRHAFRALMAEGFTEALRACDPSPGLGSQARSASVKPSAMSARKALRVSGRNRASWVQASGSAASTGSGMTL